MQEENSAYPDGVADVSVLVPLCFENPLRQEAADFLLSVLTQEKRVALPTSALMGAYHVCTSYLRVPRVAAKGVLEGILATGSPALYTMISVDSAREALDYAASYKVESWDGYLVSAARVLGSSTVYTLDNTLKKVKEISVVNPFTDEGVLRYHKFVESKLSERVS